MENEIKQDKPKQAEKPKVDKAVIDAIKAQKNLTISTNQIVTK